MPLLEAPDELLLDELEPVMLPLPVYTTYPLAEPADTLFIPSIATASDTSPTVAVSAATPTLLTVTTPSESTFIISSLLLDHTSALSVFSGSTTAAALNVVPTTTAVSSINISTLVSDLSATLLLDELFCGFKFFSVNVIPTVLSPLFLLLELTAPAIITEKRAITAITISTIAIGDSLVVVFAVPFELLSFSLCIFISILKLSHQEASIALPDTYNLLPSV